VATWASVELDGEEGEAEVVWIRQVQLFSSSLCPTRIVLIKMMRPEVNSPGFRSTLGQLLNRSTFEAKTSSHAESGRARAPPSPLLVQQLFSFDWKRV